MFLGRTNDDMPKIGGVVTVCRVVATGRDTRVNTSGVSIPDIDPNIGNRLAGIDINVLNLEVEINTITVQVLLDVTTNLLASDIVRTISDLGSQDTASVGGEDRSFKGRVVAVNLISLIVIDSFELLEGSQVTPELLRRRSDSALQAKLVGYLAATSSRTSGKRGALCGSTACVDGASEMVGQMFASGDLTLDGMVIVVLAGMRQGRNDECSSRNSAGDFGQMNHDEELLKRKCLQAMVVRMDMIVVTELVL